MEYKKAREAYDRQHRKLESDISSLQEELKQSHEKMKELESKQKVMYRARQMTRAKSF